MEQGEGATQRAMKAISDTYVLDLAQAYHDDFVEAGFEVPDA